MTVNVKIDKTELSVASRNIPEYPKLVEFLGQVQLIRPLFDFVVDEHSIQTHYTYDENDNYIQNKMIVKTKVFLEGEEIGAIGVSERSKNIIYSITSHRIRRERGEEHTTTTINPKVAIRNIKKFFIARADDEMQQLIKHTVDNKCRTYMGELEREVSWSFDDDKEGMNYALLAFQARNQGKQVVEMPAMPSTIKNYEEHTKFCARYFEMKEIDDLRQANKGYAVLMRPDEAYIIFNYATGELLRYRNFRCMPEKFQNKLGVFKLLQHEEVCQFGVMFKPQNHQEQMTGFTYFFIND